MIRLATVNDLDKIMPIFAVAREFMKNNGNPTQWGSDYPSESIIRQDIMSHHSFVVHEDNTIHGVFAFIIGEEPTYQIIKDGDWINSYPYGTIHRIASDGKTNGILEQCLDYCSKAINNLRIDTHHDNKIMQHKLMKNGFVRCGIIYVRDGSPRIAYQRCMESIG